MVILHNIGTRAIFYYFVFIKTLSLSNDECKLAYLGQYLHRKIQQALQYQDTHPLQHGILFGIFFRYFSLSLGFIFSSYVFFRLFFPATPVHISVTNTWIKKYILTWSPSGIFILVDLNKYHILLVSSKIWMVDFHGMLLICNFLAFWGADNV